MIEATVARELDAIADPVQRALIGATIHEIFLTLMLESAKQDCDPIKKAAAQEVLASGLSAVRQYTQKPRMPQAKPVRAMAAPPTNSP